MRRQVAGGRGGVQLERLRFCSLGGVPIGGYLLRWRNGGPRPLVVHGHGYGGRVRPQWSWARAGLNVVGVDVRGWGRSRPALASPSPWGWVLSGIESPERSVLRGAVCDYLRAAVIGRGLLGDVTSRVVLQGASLAGQVVCPTLVGVGLVDPVVPAPTVLAIADHLGGPAEVLRFPVSHSGGPEEGHWSAFERRWLELAAGGVPADFGR